MMIAARSHQWHNTFLKAAESEEEEEADQKPHEGRAVPCGHTALSWLGGDEQRPREGHTAFSWRAQADCAQTLVASTHRDIACRYPFFCKLLGGQFMEGRFASDERTRVTLHNLTPRGLSMLLTWMSAGDRAAALHQDTVLSVFSTAACFGVEDLANACEQYILDNLDLASAAEVKDFALAENNARLLHRARLVLGEPSDEL